MSKEEKLKDSKLRLTDYRGFDIEIVKEAEGDGFKYYTNKEGKEIGFNMDFKTFDEAMSEAKKSIDTYCDETFIYNEEQEHEQEFDGYCDGCCDPVDPDEKYYTFITDNSNGVNTNDHEKHIYSLCTKCADKVSQFIGCGGLR